MESSRLPIELCEAVMNALPEYYDFPYTGWFLVPEDSVSESESQQALCACALTCRAWRVRAQYLLWTFPYLCDSRHLAHFITAIRTSPHTTIICGLAIGNDYLVDEPDLSTAGELFMYSFPNLQHFLCDGLRFDLGPPLRLLRMRLPFFSTITTLTLFDCTFQSMRAMLDVVWACPNLATLAIGGNKVKSGRCSAAKIQHLSATAENLRACQKLTRLLLGGGTRSGVWSPAVIGISGVGRVFGCAITELRFAADRPSGELISILRDSFPTLHSVTVVESGFVSAGDAPELPWLQSIAIGRPICGILKTIVLEHEHGSEECACCKEAVGTSEEVLGSEKRLPELLAGLVELTVRLRDCEDPGRCATYILSVLPGMQNVLRFEYRAREKDAWKPYTLPVAKSSSSSLTPRFTL